jgi:hypothetical protein
VDKILKNVPKYWFKKEQPEIGDVFLLIKNDTHHYAVLTNLSRDSKYWQFWWADFCSLDAVPPRYTRWILKKDQLAAKSFKLGGDRLRAVPLSFPFGPGFDIGLEAFRELDVDTKPKAKIIDMMSYLKARNENK